MTGDAICSVLGCPTRESTFEGDSQEWHQCWAKAIRGHKCFGLLGHQHWPKKGMGGRPSGRPLSVLKDARSMRLSVARGTDRYEILKGVCAVCKKPLPNRDDVVDDEFVTPLADPTSVMITGEGLLPGVEPTDSAIDPGGLSVSSRGGMQSSPEEETRRGTIEGTGDGLSVSLQVEGSPTKPTGNRATGRDSLPKASKRTKADSVGIERGVTHGNKGLTAPLASTDMSRLSVGQGSTVMGAEALPTLLTVCCSECIAAGFALDVDHDPSIIPDSPRIVACLCAGMHDAVDNGVKYGNAVIVDGEGRQVYRLWEVTTEPPGKTLIERVIGGKPDMDTATATGWPDINELKEGRQEAAGDREVRQAHHEETLPAIQESNIISVTLPVFPRGVTPNLMGLEFDDLVTYEEWAAIGPRLALLGDWLPWAVGDWLRHGEWAYGEKYAQAASETGLKEGRLQQYQWVAEHVQNCTRVQFSSLHWTHFRQVAHLNTEEQQEWLQKAHDENLTTAELHQTLHAKELPAGPECMHEWVCKLCGRLRG